jgi:hypothetical protein
VSLFKAKAEIAIQEAELGVMKTLVKFPPLLRTILILSILAIIPSYFVAKQIAYKVWQQRDSQYSLAAKPSFENALPFKIKNTWVVQSAASSYSAVAEVSNENLDLSAGSAAYEFKFYGANKKQIVPDGGQISGRTFFLPNQSKYLLATRVISREPITKAEIVFAPNVVWKKKISLPSIKLNITGVRFSQQLNPPAFAVEGLIENTSSYQLKQSRLVFLVFDSFKRLLAVSERYEFTLGSGENRAYKQLWPEQAFPDAASVQVLAETNTLDQENLRLEKTPTGPGSDLNRPELLR